MATDKFQLNIDSGIYLWFSGRSVMRVLVRPGSCIEGYVFCGKFLVMLSCLNILGKSAC